MDSSGSWQADDRMKQIHIRAQSTNLLDNYITASFCKHSKERHANKLGCLSRLHCRM